MRVRGVNACKVIIHILIYYLDRSNREQGEKILTHDRSFAVAARQVVLNAPVFGYQEHAGRY